jgi:MFS family permease
MPVEARGLFGGILQQGYALGYLPAAVFNFTVVPKSKHGWKALFFIGAGLTGGVAIIRCFFPESKLYLEVSVFFPTTSSSITIFILARRTKRSEAVIKFPYGRKLRHSLAKAGLCSNNTGVAPSTLRS